MTKKSGKKRSGNALLAAVPVTPRTKVFPKIWQSIEAIPKGDVKTYGQVAADAGVSVRTVVWALRRCPPSVPWHRVVGKGRVLGLAKRSLLAGARQARRLSAEGWKIDQWKLCGRRKVRENRRP